MKKYITLLILAVFVISCSTSKKVQTTPVPVQEVNPLANAVDSMSYALGVNFGNSFARDLESIPGGKSNVDMLIKGFSQALRGDSTWMTEELAQSYFRDYMTREQQKENEAKKKEGEDFLAQNELREGVQTTASGLQYMVLISGSGKKPAATDVVKVHYVGTTIDGNTFDSSIQRGEPAEFGLNQVIPGWSEGVQLMNVGSKYKFLFHITLLMANRVFRRQKYPHSHRLFLK